MVRQNDQVHIRITRHDVIDLYRVSEHQAYYQLKKLGQQGDLQLVGKGRNAYHKAEKSQKNTE